LLARKLDNKLLIVIGREDAAGGDRARLSRIATECDRTRTLSYLGLALHRTCEVSTQRKGSALRRPAARRQGPQTG
jgi:hypothetical protein